MSDVDVTRIVDGEPCPQCGSDQTHHLSTLNQWYYYCPACDIRFNAVGDVHQRGSPLPPRPAQP